MGLFRRRPRGRSPERDLVEQVSAAFDGAPGVTAIEPLPDELAVVVTRGGSPLRVDLAATFAESRSDTDAERAERVARLVAAALEPGAALSGAGADIVAGVGPGAVAGPPGEGWDDARTRLRPVLRGVSWLLLGEAPEGRPAARPALPMLAEFVVVAGERTMRYATRGDLDRWGTDLDHLLDAAYANLADAATPLRERRAEDGRLLLEVTGPGDQPDPYASSLLLAPGWLRRLEEAAGSRLVVAVPARDELWAVPADDDVGLAWLVETAREAYLASPQGVSPVPYAAGAGGPAPWLPPVGSPLAVPVRAAARLLSAAEYRGQAERLVPRLEAAGEAVHVAGVDVVQRPGGEVLTWATWSRGVQSLLPETDLLAVVADPAMPESGILVRTEDAREELERWSEPAAGLVPPRRRTTGFPDAAAMERLRTLALPR